VRCWRPCALRLSLWGWRWRATGTHLTERCSPTLGGCVHAPMKPQGWNVKPEVFQRGGPQGPPVDGDVVLAALLRRYKSSCHSGDECLGGSHHMYISITCSICASSLLLHTSSRAHEFVCWVCLLTYTPSPPRLLARSIFISRARTLAEEYPGWGSS